MDIRECAVTMGRIADKQINYSDHEGVEAVVDITRTTNGNYSTFFYPKKCSM